AYESVSVCPSKRSLPIVWCTTRNSKVRRANSPLRSTSPPLYTSTVMPTLAEALDILEQHYGPQHPTFPTDPYDFLIWWHCGYPASDAACVRGWHSLTSAIHTDPQNLLHTSEAKLTMLLKPGGMVPEL